jgi:hypothetical protein
MALGLLRRMPAIISSCLPIGWRRGRPCAFYRLGNALVKGLNLLVEDIQQRQVLADHKGVVRKQCAAQRLFQLDPFAAQASLGQLRLVLSMPIGGLVRWRLVQKRTCVLRAQRR